MSQDEFIVGPLLLYWPSYSYFMKYLTSNYLYSFLKGHNQCSDEGTKIYLEIAR